MTKSKTTRKALIVNVCIILLCVSVLIGSTFAWFTDSASTSVNKIQAGTLDIAFLMQSGDDEWVTAEGKTLSFAKAAEGAGEEFLWEPGCTYTLPAVKLVNNGDLALKFALVIDGVVGADAKLAEVLKVSVNGTETGSTLANLVGDTDGAAYGILLPKDATVPAEANADLVKVEETDEYRISLHMAETAGNDYQNLSISGITLTAYASQYTFEHDSISDQYDASAFVGSELNVIDLVEDGYAKVSTYEELRASIAAGVDIVLADNITTNGANSELAVASGNSIAIDLNGYTITHDTTVSGYGALITVNNGASLTINDSAGSGAIKATANSSSSGAFALVWNQGSFVLNAGTLEFAQAGSAWGYVVDNRPNVWGNATAAPTYFTMNGGKLNAHGEEAVRVAVSSASAHARPSTFTMNGGTVTGYGVAFVQQMDSELNRLNVNLNAGTINTTTYVFRTYGNFDTFTYADGLSGAANIVTVQGAVNISGTHNYKLSTTEGINEVNVPGSLVQVY